ncbi:hypothetical protein EGW08_018286 [Elysia chlorotica]|uniref:Uncharacterized protein n=1 Tax=Elysia chlorotica TaxID=188477 RepID=A0A3S0ZFY1_ELYCH|nr:hypothetical protein EGW08_018286 [Elysia chlorotica]
MRLQCSKQYKTTFFFISRAGQGIKWDCHANCGTIGSFANLMLKIMILPSILCPKLLRISQSSNNSYGRQSIFVLSSGWLSRQSIYMYLTGTKWTREINI